MAERPTFESLVPTPTLKLGAAGLTGAATAPAAALGRIGQDLFEFGRRHQEYNENVRRANFIGTRFAALSEAAVRIEAETRKTAQPDGSDYVEKISTLFEKELSAAYEGAPDAMAREELRARATVLKSQVTRQALAQADQMLIKHTADQLERAAENYAAAVTGSPDLLDGSLDELEAQLAAARGLLPADAADELRRRSRGMLIGSAAQARLLADDLKGVDAMLADPRYVEDLSPKQILALKQDVVQRRRYLADKAEVEARQRRIEARQAAQDRGAAYGIELAGVPEIQGNEQLAYQQMRERFGNDPVALAAAVNAFDGMRRDFDAARARDTNYATIEMQRAINAGLPVDEAIKRYGAQADPGLVARLQEDLRSPPPPRVTDPRLRTLLVLGETGHPAVSAIVDAALNGQTDMRAFVEAGEFPFLDLPDIKRWAEFATPSDYAALIDVVAKTTTGNYRVQDLRGYTPKEIEEEVGSIMRLSGFDKDDKNYWPTYTRLYKGTINYVQSSGSRPTLLDLRKYMEDTLVPAMPEGEEPGLLGYIMGTAAETSLDLPAGERERAEVPPYSTLDTAQRERLATVLARDYGAPLSQDEVRQIMESATKAGLSSTLENLRDIARQMRRMRGGG